MKEIITIIGYVGFGWILGWFIGSITAMLQNKNK